jgi:exosortase/archaeosortase family protein
VAANVVRITVTGALYESSRSDLAKVVFHDVAGWLMMPLALVMLFAELEILRRVIIVKPRPGAAYHARPAAA